jgi:hypothetical protein
MTAMRVPSLPSSHKQLYPSISPNVSRPWPTACWADLDTPDGNGEIGTHVGSVTVLGSAGDAQAVTMNAPLVTSKAMNRYIRAVQAGL